MEQIEKILLISISITLLLEVQHFFSHQFTTDHSEDLINTSISSHFSKEAWITTRSACVWENFADLALVEVIDDGVVERLFELPLGL